MTRLGLLVFFTTVACDYVAERRQLVYIPHWEIPNYETVINLNHNNIEVLGDGEFSDYVFLTSCLLRDNRIISISNTAFQFTNIEILHLERNDLFHFPDLGNITSTLSVLYIANNNIKTVLTSELSVLTNIIYLDMRGNNLIDWPNTTNVGINVCHVHDCDLRVNHVQNDLQEATFCHFKTVNLNHDDDNRVPKTECPQNAVLSSLGLMRKGYTDGTDFNNLTGLTNTLRILRLNENLFTRFPNLPLKLRQSLVKLVLEKCEIATIPSSDLEGYRLSTLNLKNNFIKSITYRLFYSANQIILSDNPLKEWNISVWHYAVSTTGNLTKLVLDNTLDSVLRFPEITTALCNRINTLTVVINTVSIANFTRNL